MPVFMTLNYPQMLEDLLWVINILHMVIFIK